MGARLFMAGTQKSHHVAERRKVHSQECKAYGMNVGEQFKASKALQRPCGQGQAGQQTLPTCFMAKRAE